MPPINSISTRLSGGAIAGITVGVVVFIVLVVLAVIYVAKHQAKKAHTFSLQLKKERDMKGLTRKRNGTLSHPKP